MFYFLLLITTLISNAQKLKGSKIVTTTPREVGSFINIEVENNIELFLTRGDENALEIEADDNLQDLIQTVVTSGTLRLSSSGEYSGAKKMSVKVTYTPQLKMIIAKDGSNVIALTDLEADNLTIKSFGTSKVFCNVKAKDFTLMANDKSKIELNLFADTTVIEMSKNAALKALISSPAMTVDMYQKSTAVIEGDVLNLKLRLDANANFVGKNLTAKNSDIIAEASSAASVIVSGIATIEASGKAEIDLHGDQQKIEIRKFADGSSIRKRPLK